MVKVKKTLFLIAVFCMVCTSAYGEETTTNPDDWRFELTMYGFLASMDVTSTLLGIDTPVDLSFSDIMDNFDVFAAAGRVEAWKGKWLFITDAFYNSLKTDASLQPFKRIDVTIDIEMDVRIFNLDFAVGHRLWEPALKEGHAMPSLFFDVWAGGRYMYLKQEIDLDITAKIRRRLPQLRLGNERVREDIVIGGSHDWVEPFVGGRIGIHLCEWLSFSVRGDIGGFGIGSASDLTWNMYGIFELKPWENVSLKFGYRYWDIDYEWGDGIEEFGLTGDMQGPWLGITFYL